MSRFLESQLGAAAFALPTPRDEAWRYTALKALEQRALRVGDADAASREVDAAAYAWPGDPPRLVFVNGALRPDLSRHDGFEVDVVEPEREAGGGDALARLNALLSPVLVQVRARAGATPGEPLHVVHVGADAGGDVAWYARIAFELAEDARFAVVERHAAAAPHAHVGNVAVAIRLADRAQLHWTRIQSGAPEATLFARTHATLGAGASFDHATLDTGAILARHALEVSLAAPGASFSARGVFAVGGRQHVDTQLSVVHAARDTRCDVAYRGLADGRARGVFGGAIAMQPGADGADARLENKNLLLSPHAEIDTKPVLEIHADEVKASHGATVGQLDERALFYLRSRGVPLAEARSLLTYAFAAAMFDAQPAPLRDELRRLLATSTAAGRTAGG